MKSHASDLLELQTCILTDAYLKCLAKQPDLRDIKTIESRVKHEGISFLTITLPTLGSDLEKALSLGSTTDPTLFRCFKKRGKIPAFMQAIFGLVFDLGTGGLLDEPSIPAIEAIRQVAYSFKKARVECAPARVRATFQKFISCEQDLTRAIASGDADYFHSVSNCVWGPIVGVPIDWNADVRPKHGPGATAERIGGNSKYVPLVWHDRLEPYFPILDNAFANAGALDSREFKGVSVVSPDQERPVRVIPVPKTLKGPRIIAIEPVCMQYTQQAISKWLVSRLESHQLTKGHINFTDQSINRRLALEASKTEELATLDLSSASDRVPFSLAISMFRSNPELQAAIASCRSTRAQLPVEVMGELAPLQLNKFASMGSALCFPVEAMYFYTICVAALLRWHDLPVTSRNVSKVSRYVYVYGDDIIVPAGAAKIVSDTLHKYYCKVNVSKSFSTGRFRESCGMDAYAGEEVTPTYIREMRPRGKRSSCTSNLVSWVATSNLFYRKGYWRTSSYMLNVCEDYLGKLPIVGPDCSGLGALSFQPYVSAERYNRRYQVHEVKTWVVSSAVKHDPLNGQGALVKCLLKLEERQATSSFKRVVPDEYSYDYSARAKLRVTSSDEKHLAQTEQRGAVTLKRRWSRPY